MSELAFQVEAWPAVAEEIKPLIAAHWSEMPFDVSLPLEPDYALYRQLDVLARLHILTARADGELVGYFIAFLGRHPHYDIRVGSMDIYYLAPKYRRGLNGLRLFEEYERTIRTRGARFLMATARLDREQNAAKLFERLGWQQARMLYSKRLED